MFGKGLRISILGLSVCVCSCVCRQPSLTLFICYRALLCSVSHWHCAQSHKPRCEAGGGGLYCHINKHMHNQDPEKVQWESRCHFSHVALMGAWRVNILIIFFFQPPWLGSSGALHLEEVGKQWVWCSHWIITTHINVHCCHGYSFKCSREPAILWWTSYSVIICRTGITVITATKTTCV